MAAPLMWFGEGFYSIIPKEELLRFKYASMIKQPSFDMVAVKLFDLYENPAKEENRNRQKEFWQVFNLQKKVEAYKYKREKEIGLI